MPGANNGTGRPIVFRCSNCRSKHLSWGSYAHTCGYISDIKLLGQRRKAPIGNAGIRNSKHKFCYVCDCCSHVGWSRHTDLEWLWEKEYGDKSKQRVNKDSAG